MSIKKTYFISVKTSYIDGDFIKEKIKTIYRHYGHMHEVEEILSVIKKYYREADKNFVINSQVFIISQVEFCTKGESVKIPAIH